MNFIFIILKVHKVQSDNKVHEVRISQLDRDIRQAVLEPSHFSPTLLQ